MSRIDPSQPPTGPLRKAEVSGAPKTAPLGPKAPSDAINISVDARVKLGKDNKPEVVVDGLTVEGVDAQAQAAVDKNLQGRRKGLREQITAQVVQQIAQQVALAVMPKLESELGNALEAEHLPASLAADLARQTAPEIAKLVAAKIAEKVTITTK